MLEFPQIPEHPESLSAPELRTLAAEIRRAVHTAAAGAATTVEDVERMEQAVADRAMLLGLAGAAERRLQLAADMSDESEDESPEVDETDEGEESVDEVDEGDDEEGDDADDETEGDANDVDRTPVAVGAAASMTVATTSNSPAKVRTTTGVPAKAASTRVDVGQLAAVEGIAGKRAGQQFTDWTEFSQSLLDKARLIDPGSKEKYHVGRAHARFTPEQRLSEDLLVNLKMFEREEIVAAMCAPAIPLYDLACANTARRPVRNSFASFQPAARGKVSVYPSPALDDITTGFGVWTDVEDSDPEAVKDPCQTIECATPVEYALYGIYRCLTVKNLLQLTFPELVEAYLNRLAARWARLAEVTLLNAMGTAADTTVATGTGWGGTTSLLRAILQYLNKYQELQRWDNPAMDVWMHRGVLLAIKADMISRRRTDGGRNTVPSDAEVNRMFTDAGATPHWTLDVGNWMTALEPFEGGGGQLGAFPRSVEMLIAPQGKFAVLDRGELSVGVTGNGIYRDNTSNSRNEFTFFFESFEGLVDTDSCPAHVIQLDDLCWNGRQVADVLVGCSGEAVDDASGAI